MGHKIQKLRESVITLKTKATYKYYQFRINTVRDSYRIRLRKNPYRILFIFGHMRSGSSLLVHLLNSNPEIIGYGETHLEYTSELDFKKLMFKVYWKLKELDMSHQYLFDKILHDHKLLEEKLLDLETLDAIFLIREPKRTLASIIDLKPHWTEEKALNYYIQRLLTLERYAKIINSKERSLWLDYDQLLHHSNSVFETLQSFLGTKEGFSEKYEILKTTGIRGIGDSSANIKAGQIIRNPRELKAQISQDSLDKARQYFEQCSATLSQYCRTIEIIQK
jgi:hypothetical protein